MYFSKKKYDNSHLKNISDPSESPFSSGRRWYFARGMSEGMRQLVGKLSLKRRQYIGPTSTESELSILMANQVYSFTPSQKLLENNLYNRVPILLINDNK